MVNVYLQSAVSALSGAPFPPPYPYLIPPSPSYPWHSQHESNSQSWISNNHGSRNDDLPQGAHGMPVQESNSQSWNSYNYGTRNEDPQEGTWQHDDGYQHNSYTQRWQWQNDQHRWHPTNYSTSSDEFSHESTIFDSTSHTRQQQHVNSQSWISHNYGSRNDDSPEGELFYTNPLSWTFNIYRSRWADSRAGAHHPTTTSNHIYHTLHYTHYTTPTQSSLHNIWSIAHRWHNSSFSRNDNTVTGSRPDEWGAGRAAGYARRTRSVLLHPASDTRHRNTQRGLRSGGSTTCRHAGRALVQTVRRRAVRAMRASVCQKTSLHAADT